MMFAAFLTLVTIYNLNQNIKKRAMPVEGYYYEEILNVAHPLIVLGACIDTYDTSCYCWVITHCLSR